MKIARRPDAMPRVFKVMARTLTAGVLRKETPRAPALGPFVASSAFLGWDSRIITTTSVYLPDMSPALLTNVLGRNRGNSRASSFASAQHDNELSPRTRFGG